MRQMNGLRAVSLAFAILLVVCAGMEPVAHGDFFYEQREDDLYVVMEKITSVDQLERWQAIFEFMEDGRRSYQPEANTGAVFKETCTLIDTTWAACNKSPKRWGFHAGSGNAGFVTLEEVKPFLLDPEKPIEAWVGYFWSSAEAPSRQVDPAKIMNIEMAITVTTRLPFLYAWHMGITRNYLWMYYQNVHIHKNISVLLHAYAAKIMLTLHPELYFVRSYPAEEMVEILKQALRSGIDTLAFFAPVRREVELIRYNMRDETARLFSADKDLNGERSLLWEGPIDDFDWPRFGGGGGFRFLADIGYLAAFA